MRVWIDIANAPHATLFAPVADALSALGWEAVVTTWRRGQTYELAAAHWPDAIAVDAGSFTRSRAAKATRIWTRAAALADAVRRADVDVALGHNSYAQLLAARRLRLPSLTMMDYEHQPANHLAFRLADRVLLPAAIPDAAVRRFGLRPSRIVRYPGVKEEITLSTYRPDHGFRSVLGLDPGRPLVTVRPAAEGALYHRHGNPVLDDLLIRLAASDAQVLLTPRTKGQAQRYSGRDGIRVLAETVNGADLLFHTDVFVGAGGTMTREAAVLGTKTFSVFAGRPGAVDAALEREGRLRTLRTAQEVMDEVGLHPKSWTPDPGVVRRFAELVDDQLVSLAKARPRPGRR